MPVKKVLIGTSKPQAVYVGTSKVKLIYVGTTLVYTDTLYVTISKGTGVSSVAYMVTEKMVARRQVRLQMLQPLCL